MKDELVFITIYKYIESAVLDRKKVVSKADRS